MTVFVWSPMKFPDEHTRDQFCTMWAEAPVRCVFCDEAFQQGEKVWSWDVPRRRLTAHADCIKKHSVGILKDFAECLR